MKHIGNINVNEAYRPLLAVVSANRNHPDTSVCHIGPQLCFFETGTTHPRPGDTVEVMIMRATHPRDATGEFDFGKVHSLIVQVIDPARHIMLAIDGFRLDYAKGGACASGAVGRDDAPMSILHRAQERYGISPGRTGPRVAVDGETPVPTFVWAVRKPNSAQPVFQPGIGATALGLTGIDDLAAAAHVRRGPPTPAATATAPDPCAREKPAAPRERPGADGATGTYMLVAIGHSDLRAHLIDWNDDPADLRTEISAQYGDLLTTVDIDRLFAGGTVEGAEADDGETGVFQILFMPYDDE